MPKNLSKVERSKAAKTYDRTFDDLKSISQEFNQDFIERIITYALGSEMELSGDEQAGAYTVYRSIAHIVSVFHEKEPQNFNDAPELLDWINNMLAMGERQAEKDFFSFIIAISSNDAYIDEVAGDKTKVTRIFIFIQLMLTVFHNLEASSTFEKQAS